MPGRRGDMAQEANLSEWPCDLVQVFAVLGAAMAGKRLTPQLVNDCAPAWRAAVAGQDAREKQATPPAPGSRVASQPSGRMNSGG